MAYLTKEQILQATDVDVEEIEVPEWGGVVRVCGLDAQYVQRLIQSGFIDARSGNADIGKLDLIELAARSLVDEKGEALLTRNEAKTLGKKSFAPLMRVATKALQLTGFAADEDEDEPKNE
jgi:hypothetical protein